MFDDALSRLRAGDREALWDLMDIGPEVVPLASSAFRSEPLSEVRVGLVHVVWQERSVESIPFLSEALDDPDSEVWKEAIDGLVALGTAEARRILWAARSVRPNRATGGEHAFAFWLDDAIAQIDRAGS